MNHKESGHDGGMGMMWLMMAMCAIPLLILLVTSVATWTKWLVVGMLALYAVIHLSFMRSNRHQKSSEGKSTNEHTVTTLPPDQENRH